MDKGEVGYPVPDDKNITSAFEKLEGAEDFLAQTGQTAIEAAIAAHRSTRVYKHSYNGNFGHEAAQTWAGQPNSAL